MTDAAPAILSMVMLACFALAGGGGWLIHRRRDRKRGALMLVAAAVLFGNALIWAWPARAGAPLPDEVRALVERRSLCQHWLGEEPYDAARRSEIAHAVRLNCTGNDRRLARLRRKYAGRAIVLRALAAPPLG